MATKTTSNPDQELKPQKPLDKAEGDEETVDESIRIHEKKGDLAKPPKK